ncbi:hypothetical protein JW978_01160 [Candidatus Dojkabacteria bacterium]|nr:hypothetical protein [Candidatus Dojkabacteria bacterium]
MLIENLRIKKNTNSTRVSVTLSYEKVGVKNFELYFEVNKQYSKFLSKSYDGFLAAVLIPSMGIPENIQINGAVDEAFLDNIDKLQKLIRPWEVSDSWHKKLNTIEIRTDQRQAKSSPKSLRIKKEKSSAMFFTAGVDSFYTMLNLQKDKKTNLKYLLSIIGYDIDIENKKLSKEFLNSLDGISKATGLRSIIVQTNYREFLNLFPVNSANEWEMCHGAGLAAAALIFRNLFGQVYINSSDSYITGAAYGTHPDMDPLWSNSSLKFIPYGSALSRIEKIKDIKDNLLVRKYLRVCWRNIGNQYNCSQCEKCLRTMLQLKIYGVLNKFEKFKHNIDESDFDSIDTSPKHRIYVWEYFLKHLGNDEGQLKESLRRYISRSYQEIFRKNNIYYKIIYLIKLIRISRWKKRYT